MKVVSTRSRSILLRCNFRGLALVFLIVRLIVVSESSLGADRGHAKITVLGVNRTGETMVRLRGEIRSGDGKTFLAIAGVLTKAVILLDSPGGIGLDGLIIGEAVRTRGFATIVPPRATCASACAIIWISGVRRTIGPGGRVGFHAAFETKSHRISGSENALVGAFLKSLDLPYETIAYLTNAAPSSITWLEPDTASKHAIEVGTYDPQATQAEPEATRHQQLKPYVVRAAKATVACMHYLMLRPGLPWLRRKVPRHPRYMRYNFEANCSDVEAGRKFVVTQTDPAANLLCIRAAMPNCDWVPAADFRATADPPWAAAPVTLVLGKSSAGEPLFFGKRIPVLESISQP